jgi:hypothetical protein
LRWNPDAGGCSILKLLRLQLLRLLLLVVLVVFCVVRRGDRTSYVCAAAAAVAVFTPNKCYAHMADAGQTSTCRLEALM